VTIVKKGLKSQLLNSKEEVAVLAIATSLTLGKYELLTTVSRLRKAGTKDIDREKNQRRSTL
jgi:hypothetical protein